MEIFWNIKDINLYESFFQTGIQNNSQFSSTYALIKNLSYNLQYLEYINNALQIDIHASIKMELYKSFVITGVSIIESILYYLLKSNGLQKNNIFENIGIIGSNEKEIKGTVFKFETTILQKLTSPIEEEMSLDYMLRKTETKYLLGKDHSIYQELNHLRKLRNKIHLYLIEAKLDTDWNNFSIKEFALIKKSLKKVFYSDVFTMKLNDRDKLFSFL